MNQAFPSPQSNRHAPVVLGEINTAMLRTSSAVPRKTAEDLLEQLSISQTSRSRTRPTRITWSPRLFRGIDCQLPAGSGRSPRIVGTVRSELSLTDGRLLQSNSWVTVRDVPSDRRHQWSHYTRFPGTAELIGRAPQNDVAEAFLGGPTAPSHLNLGGINTEYLDSIQRSVLLARQEQPFRTRRIRVRWAVRPPSQPGERHVNFTTVDEGLRTLEIQADGVAADHAREFCADVALHDWLLSTLGEKTVEHLDSVGRDARDVRDRLLLTLESLAHSWMPGARTDDDLADFWPELQQVRRLGLDQQWTSTVTRVRDHIDFRRGDERASIAAGAAGEKS